jgi:hypothetical protein
MVPLPDQPGSNIPDHEWVSPACLHRRHDACELGCPMCGSECLCCCHRWAIPVNGHSIGHP